MGWRRSIFERFVAASSLLAPTAPEVPAAPEKILVLRNNDIGDLLVVTPLFEALKRIYPNVRRSPGSVRGTPQFYWAILTSIASWLWTRPGTITLSNRRRFSVRCVSPFFPVEPKRFESCEWI